MERHVSILAILCTLWGALAMLVGASLLLLSAGALAILFGPDGSAVGFAAGVTATGWSFASPSGERFLGLGERSDGADQTGHLVESWNEEGPFSAGALRPYTEPVLGDRWQGPPPIPGTNFSLPWLVSSRGYGLLLDSGYPNRFRLQNDRADAWNVETEEPSFRYRVYAGPTPGGVVQRFTADIGRQPAPATWFFGPWYQPAGDTAFRNELRAKWREWDVPVTVAQTYTHYLPCGAQVGNRDGQKKQVADYHAAGYMITTYVNSFVCNSHAGGAYQDGDSNGFFVKTKLGTTYPVPYVAANANLDAPYSAVVDFTNPAATKWWQGLINDALEDGYDGWMEDFGEYVPPDAMMADGRPGIAAHNEYCTDYHRASHELTSVVRGLDFAQFVRCGYTGTARYARIVWGADPSTDDSKADGLGAAVTQGLSMGLSGVAYWGSDIGGYHALFTGGQTGPELLTRWLEFGAFSGIMRTEADGYAFDNSVRAQVWDPDVRPTWRLFAKLRTQLFPYIWQAAETYRETGMPIMRHLSLAYPGDSAIYRPDAEYEYLFGPDLLVAPVIDEGARTRTLYLPPGEWLNFWDATSYDDATGAFTAKPGSEVLAGGRVITVEAPLDRIPLFVRAGACLPLLPPNVDTLADVGTGVVHLSDVAGDERLLGFGAAC